MLVVSLCRPVIHKLKPLGRGNWNILNQWAEATKRGEPNFKISVEGSRIGERNLIMVFDSNLVGESLGGN